MGKCYQVWVYLSSPYSKGDKVDNVKAHVRMWARLTRLFPTVVFVAPLFGAATQMWMGQGTELLGEKQWLGYDLKLLKKCDALFAFDSVQETYRESVGCIEEIAQMNNDHKKVFVDENALTLWLNNVI